LAEIPKNICCCKDIQENICFREVFAKIRVGQEQMQDAGRKNCCFCQELIYFRENFREK
jgi:hypothetical protein